MAALQDGLLPVGRGETISSREGEFMSNTVEMVSRYANCIA